jgi:hypothetical protein
MINDNPTIPETRALESTPVSTESARSICVWETVPE